MNGSIQFFFLLFTCALTLVRREIPPKNVPQHFLSIGRQHHNFNESHVFENACTVFGLDGMSRIKVGKSKPKRSPNVTQDVLHGTTPLGSVRLGKRYILLANFVYGLQYPG